MRLFTLFILLLLYISSAAQGPARQRENAVYFFQKPEGFTEYNITYSLRLSDGSLLFRPYAQWLRILKNNRVTELPFNLPGSATPNCEYAGTLPDGGMLFINNYEGKTIYHLDKAGNLLKVIYMKEPTIKSYVVGHEVFFLAYNNDNAPASIYRYANDTVVIIGSFPNPIPAEKLLSFAPGRVIASNEKTVEVYAIQLNGLIDTTPIRVYNHMPYKKAFYYILQYYDDNNFSLSGVDIPVILQVKDGIAGWVPIPFHSTPKRTFPSQDGYIVSSEEDGVVVYGVDTGKVYDAYYTSLFKDAANFSTTSQSNLYGTLGSSGQFGYIFNYLYRYPHAYGFQNSYNTFTLVQAQDGAIWAGSYNRGMGIIDKDRIQNLQDPLIYTNGGITIGNKVFLIEESASSGVVRYDENKKLTRLVDTTTGFFLFKSSDSFLYYCTNFRGLWRCPVADALYKDKINWQQYGSKAAMENSVNILAAAEDKNGKIWLSLGRKGIGLFDPTTSEVQYYLKSKGQSDKESMTMLADSHHTIWVGSYAPHHKGLYYYDTAKIEQPFNDTNFKAIIHPLLQDEDNMISFLHQWRNYIVIGAGNKMLLFDVAAWYRDGCVLVKYLNPLEAGSFTNTTEQNTVLTDKRDSSIWFATHDMIYQWDIVNWLKNPLPNIQPRLLINGSSDTLYTNKINRFPSHQNSLHLTLDYQTQDNLPRYFRYALYKNNDSIMWSAIDWHSSISFSNISWGNYKLHIQLCQADGSYDEYVYAIHINKPLDQQAWFWVTIISALFIPLLLWINARRRSEQHKKEKIAYNLKSLSQQFRPHFILNALNTVSAELYHNERALTIVEKMGDSVNRIYRQTQQGRSWHSFQDEWELAVNTIEILQLSYLPTLETNIYSMDITSYKSLRVPIGILQIPVENALLHGLRNKKNPPYILDITINDYPDYWLISILDNGVGLKNVPNKNKRTRASSGLQNLQTIIQILNSKNANTIKLIIKDRELEGAQTCITLPKHYDYE